MAFHCYGQMEHYVETYNSYCRTHGKPITPVLPASLHTCNRQCPFYRLEPLIYICTFSRIVHICSSKCPNAIRDEVNVCGLTGRVIGVLFEYDAFDGTSTVTQLTAKRRKINLPPKNILLLIKQTIQNLFMSDARFEEDENKNQRLAKECLLTTTKKARRLKLHRGSWRSFFALYNHNLQLSKRFMPNAYTIERLTQCIFRFHETVNLASITKTPREIVIFTALCLCELAHGETEMFPRIAWLHHSLPKLTNIYRKCLNITSRQMTKMLNELFEKNGTTELRFPVI